MLQRVDVVVVGLGPAGRALAGRCLQLGLDVAVVDPDPYRVWLPTYAAWADEVPGWVDRDALAVEVAPSIHALRRHQLDRRYVVFDSAHLQRSLRLDGAAVITGRAARVQADRVELDDGRAVLAAHVFDARGIGLDEPVPQQTAYGIVVPAVVAEPALDGQAAWFMDWRRDNGTVDDEVPSFLYAVPLGGGRVLLEETVLAAAPPVPPVRLRDRLLHRLAARGVVPSAVDDARSEQVRIPLYPNRSRAISADCPTAFGTAGSLIHPCTGYSVGAALQLAEPVAEAVAGGSDPGRVLWPWGARGVRVLRGRSLAALLALDPTLVPQFFEVFFALSPSLQRDFLSARDRPAAVAAAMWEVFRGAPQPVRRTLLGAMTPARHRPRTSQR